MEDLTISPFVVAGVLLLLYLFSSIKILAEYERGVIFRLGKLLPHPKGPGLVFVFRPLDRLVHLSERHDVDNRFDAVLRRELEHGSGIGAGTDVIPIDRSLRIVQQPPTQR